MAHDDPEGWEFYNRTMDYAGGDPDIHILSNLNNVGSVEVNAFQVISQAVIQKSIREGFGLTVSEALWKGRPVVAGRVGGILSQIRDGETGYLVESAHECAEACVAILDDPERARSMARAGKEHVRQHFLMPRLLRDWLALFGRLAGHESGAALTTVAPAG
jgi:trehalose synthase